MVSSQIDISIKWHEFFTNDNAVYHLETDVLPGYIKKCRWFGGKARVIDNFRVDLNLPLTYDKSHCFMLVVEINYRHGESEYYFLPIAFVGHGDDEHIDDTPYTTICEINTAEGNGRIIDASYDNRFRNFLFQSIVGNKNVNYKNGVLLFQRGSKLTISGEAIDIQSHVLKADQSNTAIIYDGRYFFKFYRKVEKEINSDLEIVRFLSEKTTFKNSPSYAGSIEFNADQKSMVFGLLQEMVQNKGEAWNMTLDALNTYYNKIVSEHKDSTPPELIDKPAIFPAEAPNLIIDLIGIEFCERVMKLGHRTAEMHLALASEMDDKAFAPEQFDSDYQHGLFSSMNNLAEDRLELLKQKVGNIPEAAEPLAREILDRKEEITACLRQITDHELNTSRTRTHGDYHLGQILFTGDDFVIIDYEGEPGFSFRERRLKKNPFKDVAGMVRSFHYAAYGKIMLNDNYKDKYQQLLEPWAEQWFHYISKFYLAAYLEGMGMDTMLSTDNKILLEVYTLEKAIYELGYEMNSRPDWVVIPLRGIKFLVDQCAKTNN